MDRREASAVTTVGERENIAVNSHDWSGQWIAVYLSRTRRFQERPAMPSIPGTDAVLYVEDDDDLRELVGEVVAAVARRRYIGVGSYEELVAMGGAALECGVAILDINLGINKRSGIDAYTWLRAGGYTGRIVFLSGHASTHPVVVEAQRAGDAEVLPKPIELDRLQSIVEGKSP